MAEQDVSGAGVDAEPRGGAVVHPRPDPDPPAAVPAAGSAQPSDPPPRPEPPAGDVTADPPAATTAPTPAPFPAEPNAPGRFALDPPAESFTPERLAPPFEPSPAAREPFGSAVSPLTSEPLRPIKPFRLAGRPAGADEVPGPDPLPAPQPLSAADRAAGSEPYPVARVGSGRDQPGLAAVQTAPAVTSVPGAPFAVARPVTFRSASARDPDPVGSAAAVGTSDGAPPDSAVRPLPAPTDVAWDQAVREQVARDLAAREQEARIPAQRLGRFASRQAAGRSAPAHHAVATSDGGRLVPIVSAGFALSGIALTGAALVGADRSLGPARTLALAAAGVAAVAASVATGILLSRLAVAVGSRGRARRSAGGSLAGVAAVLPGVLVVVALALAGAAVAVTVVGPPAPAVPRLALSTARDGEGGRVVRVEATVGGLAEGDAIAVSLSVLGDGATLLSSAVQRASGAATDTVRLSGTVLDGGSVQVDVNVPGRLCRAVLPVRSAVAAEDTRVTCRSR